MTDTQTAPIAVPHSPEAERGILASLLLDPAKCLPVAVAKIGDGSAFFHLPVHRRFWAAILEFHQDGRAMDPLQFHQYFADRQTEDGLPAELRSDRGALQRFCDGLLTYVPTAGNFAAYLTICEEKKARRAMMSAARRLWKAALAEDTPWLEALESGESALWALRDVKSHKETRHAKDVVNEVVDRLETVYKRRGQSTHGIPTGFADIDRTVQGWQKGWLIIIAARPAMGKTSLAANFAEGCAVDLGEKNVPAAFYSLEMSDVELVERMMLGRGAVDFGKARSGMFSKRDFSSISTESTALSRSKLYLFDGWEATINDIRAAIRRDVRKHGIQIAFVDYLQKIKASTKAGERETRVRIEQTCQGLKGLAKELQIPIVALAQTGRSAEDNPGKVPNLKDLEHASAIEQEADCVSFIHRPSYYKKFDALPDGDQGQWHEKAAEYWKNCGDAARQTWARYYTTDSGDPVSDIDGRLFYTAWAVFSIKKFRHGPVGDIDILFHASGARFASRTAKLYSNDQAQRQML